ncbi:13619_t:CDS:2 [Dentiscutata erythropus]|uniref:13619_t:CDS:1 n=1 Tax=Dentiscutata erythropus TaxID=1348616 RepID=A0A9N9BVL1_9GLOM|nr:13619_t:CDS:2 [Dentiscutata erythropus]
MAAESASSRQSSDPKQDGRSAQESDKKEEGGKPPHDEGSLNEVEVGMGVKSWDSKYPKYSLARKERGRKDRLC